MPNIVTRPAGGAASFSTGSLTPADATYLVLTSSAALTNERVVIVGDGIKVVDDGATLRFAIDKVFHEVPSGSIDGVNRVFTLQFAPSPPESLQVFRRGLHLASGSSAGDGDYYLSGTNTIVMKRAPKPNQPFFVHYFK